MKLKVLFAVVLFFAGTKMHAQRQRVLYNNAVYTPLTDQTSWVFAKSPYIGYFPHQLKIVAQNKTIIDIRLQQMGQLPLLMNLDSMLTRVWADVEPLKDSFPNDLNNRLLDVNYVSGGYTKMRIKNYAPRGSSFVKTDNGLSLLKIEQDTLYIAVSIPEKKPRMIVMTPGAVSKNVKDTFTSYSQWTVAIYINNLSEIPSIIGTLNQHINAVAADYAALYNYKAPNNYTNKINLIYEPYSNYTGKNKYIVYKQQGRKRKHYFTPLTQVGVQNVRSAFTVSASVGAGFSSIIMDNPGNAYYLAWEPFFFFDKNGNGKTVIQRNDFITFQYRNQFGEYRKGADVNISNSFSLGYLVYREGDHFNEHTFKLGLPGMQLRNMLLQPQFIFNDFFKQFYPSLKLQVQID